MVGKGTTRNLKKIRRHDHGSVERLYISMIGCYHAAFNSLKTFVCAFKPLFLTDLFQNFKSHLRAATQSRRHQLLPTFAPAFRSKSPQLGYENPVERNPVSHQLTDVLAFASETFALFQKFSAFQYLAEPDSQG